MVYSGSPTSRFDSLPHHQRVKLLLAEAFAKKMEWTGVRWNSDRTRVLDYGCGSGLISQILAPYVKQVIGVDPSEAMVMEYNHKVYEFIG